MKGKTLQIFPSGRRPLAALFLGLALLLAACAPSTQPAVEPPANPIAPSGPPAETQAAPAATEPPAGAGTEIGNPAPRSQTITSAGWEFNVVEVLRGDQALAKLKDASPFNGPPEDASLEWAVLRIHVRYVRDSTAGMRVAKSFFSSAGSDGTLYKRPLINDVTNPEPELDAVLKPGEETEGWITVFSPKGDAGPILVIQPYVYNGDTGMSTGPADRRYILLGP